MRLKLAGLLGAAVVTGCTDGDRSYTHSAGLSGGPAAGSAADDRGATPGDHDGVSADDSRGFVLRLAAGTAPRDKGAVEVVVRSESARVSGPYQIRIVALVPAGEGKADREVSLGAQDVYRPLDKGDTTTIYLDEVVREAWTKQGDRFELRVAARAEPARPGLPKPDLVLKVVDAAVAE